MQTNSRRLVKNTIFSLLARGAELGAGFITIILAARYLGIEIFGEYAFIRAIVFMLAPMINFGIERILIRDISIRKSRASVLVCSGLALNLSVGISLCIIAIIVSHIFRETAFFPISVFAIAIIAQMLQVMTKTISSVYVAYEKIYFDLIATIISRSLIIILFIIIAYCDMNGKYFFHAFAFANATAFIFSIIILEMKFIRPVWSINSGLIAYLIKQSFPIAVAVFMIQGYNNIFVFFLKLLRDTIEVSLFQAPQRIIQQCLVLPRSFLFAYVPTLSRMAQEGQSLSTLRDTYRRMVKYIFIFTLPASVFVTAFADEFVFLAFGSDFSKAAAPLKILIWAINLLFINMLLDFILTSMRKQNILIVSNGLCLAVSSALGFIFVQKYGYFGACWATLLSYVILVITNFYFVSKHLGLIPVHLIVLKPILCCSVLGAILLEYSDNIHMVILIITGLLIYTVLLFLMRTFTHEELSFLKHGVIIKLKRRLNGLFCFPEKNNKRR
ncbi:MAG: flippase [Deltaproteobacteria bacterium]|nr:flippase [Deltaproteobacteria bacterium]